MNSIINTWVFLGIIYLSILTYQDIKNKMIVDDRKNYFMMGLTVALSSVGDYKLIYMVCIFATTILMGFFLNKIKAIGEADVSTISWIFVGYCFLNAFKLLYFFGVLAVLSFLYIGMAKIIQHFSKRAKVKIPFYPVLLSTFILTNMITA